MASHKVCFTEEGKRKIYEALTFAGPLDPSMDEIGIFYEDLAEDLLDAGEIQCGVSGDRKRKATTTSNIFYNLLLKYDLFNDNCTVFTYLT
ncbi:Hypothetical predicted protein [Paramuricea clavata]|uniref:Uncharacterized protein n=1 Tax=Paramuricea clavata TaxID=317549 RepID=A0A7D9DIU5_PARCT|nr:Hypothetical predicted protein [Paramuricea clavata]